VDHFEAHLKREGLPVLRWAGGTYRSVGALLSSLDWIEAESLVVLSPDGMSIDGASVTRSLNHTADFTSVEGPLPPKSHASVVAARGTLSRWDGDVQFVDVRFGKP
jgi:hypothetical protein